MFLAASCAGLDSRKGDFHASTQSKLKMSGANNWGLTLVTGNEAQEIGYEQRWTGNEQKSLQREGGRILTPLSNVKP